MKVTCISCELDTELVKILIIFLIKFYFTVLEEKIKIHVEWVFC